MKEPVEPVKGLFYCLAETRRGKFWAERVGARIFVGTSEGIYEILSRPEFEKKYTPFSFDANAILTGFRQTGKSEITFASYVYELGQLIPNESERERFYAAFGGETVATEAGYDPG